MLSSGRQLVVLVVAVVGVFAGFVITAFTSSSTPSTPGRTLQTFLNASASGDAQTACAQLSPQARAQVVPGTSCVQGIHDGAQVYASIIKQITVDGPRIEGSVATATTLLEGRPTATFTLHDESGKWLIVQESRVKSNVVSSAATNTTGPSLPHVENVANCLDQSFRTVDNGGLDNSGGVPHVVLTVGNNGSTLAEVDVFSSALTALAGYRALRSFDAGRTVTLASTSVVVPDKKLPGGQLRTMLDCG